MPFLNGVYSLPFRIGTNTPTEPQFSGQVGADFDDLAGIVNGQPFFNIKNFGAIGDGNTDDTAAINATIAAAGDAGGGTVLVPAGDFRHSGITFANYEAVKLSGVANLTFRTNPTVGSRLTYTGTDSDWVTIGEGFGNSIDNILFNADGNVMTAGNAIRLINESNVSYFSIFNCRFEDVFNGLYLTGSGLYIERVFIGTQTGDGDFGFKWSSTTPNTAQNQCVLKDVYIRPDNPGSTTFNGFVIGDDVNTLEAISSGTTNCNVGWKSGVAILLNFLDCGAEFSTGNGWEIDSGGVNITNIYSNVNGGSGIKFLENSVNVHLSDGNCFGNDNNGAEVWGSGPVQIDHITINQNGADGILLKADVTNVNCESSYIVGNTTNGIEIETGGGDWLIFTGNIFHDNGGSDIVNGATGTNLIISCNLPTSLNIPD